MLHTYNVTYIITYVYTVASYNVMRLMVVSYKAKRKQHVRVCMHFLTYVRIYTATKLPKLSTCTNLQKLL